MRAGPRPRRLLLVSIAALALATPAVPVTSAASAPPAIGGFGTPTIDGRFGPSEWLPAGRVDLLIPVPDVVGGGTIPATLFVMNDASNLYAALRLGRTIGFAGFWLEFNNDDDGSLESEQGDDAVAATLEGTTTRFYDLARLWCVPPDLDNGSWCGPPDTDTAPDYPLPGTVDGRAVASQPDGLTVLELAHPLDSADDARDFSLRGGSTVGFSLMVQLVSRTGGARCTADWSVCSTDAHAYGRIAIARPSATASAPAPSVSGVISQAANASGWRTAGATVQLRAGAGATTITYWTSTPSTVSTWRVVGGSNIAPITVGGRVATVRVGAEGTTVVHAFATGADGRAGPWLSVPVRIDRTAPAVAGAYVSFVAPSTLGVGAGSARVTWSGVDALAGVARYELAESRAGGPFVSIGSTGPRVSETRRHLGIGVEYRYRVRAVDAAGNASAWATGPSYRIAKVDSTAPAITLTGRWRTGTDADAIGGSTIYATETGATASLTFYGSAVAWIAPTGPGRGWVVVSIDGTPAVRDTVVRPTASTRLVYAKSWSTPGRHTISVEVEGTPGRPRVDVDAFLVATAGTWWRSTSVEAEALPITTYAVPTSPTVQTMPASGPGGWSGSQQLLVRASDNGSLWFDVPFGQAGRYKVVLYATKGPSSARVQAQFVSPTTNAVTAELYAPQVVPSGPIVLGTLDLWGQGDRPLSLKVVGKNAASSGYDIGLDRLVLTPAP